MEASLQKGRYKLERLLNWLIRKYLLQIVSIDRDESLEDYLNFPLQWPKKTSIRLVGPRAKSRTYQF